MRGSDVASASVRPELIERIESGSGYDNELNRDVALALGWTIRLESFGPRWQKPSGEITAIHGLHEEPFNFTTSLDAVVSLIEQKLPEWWGTIDIGDWRDNPYGARLRLRENAAAANGRGTSPARALLAACLRALSVLENSPAGLADAHSKDPSRAAMPKEEDTSTTKEKHDDQP